MIGEIHKMRQMHIRFGDRGLLLQFPVSGVQTVLTLFDLPAGEVGQPLIRRALSFAHQNGLHILAENNKQIIALHMYAPLSVNALSRC